MDLSGFNILENDKYIFQNVNILYISTFKTLSNYLESVFFLYLEHILEHIN